MDGAEAAANMVAARAGRPLADGVESDGHTHEGACLNCGVALAGAYCHGCGQRGHVHRTIAAFVHDLLHGVLHFEGKTAHTLPLLAWRPGELTRRYVHGERARFVSPMALFLFSVFLMFAVVSSIGDATPIDSGEIRSELAQDVAKSAQQIKNLEAQRAAARTAGQTTAEIDRKITETRAEARLMRDLAGRGVIRGSAVRVSDDVPPWLGVPLLRAAKNPELLLYKVRTNGYKYSWALIPLSLPFMWLLFPFSRRFKLYDHIVFVTYSLGFMTLLVVVASLLYAVGLGAVAGFAMLIPPFHMYRQLKGAYGLTRWGALWRTLLLLSFAMVAAGLFVALLFAMGLF